MAETVFIPLSFEKGINEYAEASELPDGYGTVIQNWIPEASGSLRVPWAWLSASTGGYSLARTVRGIGYYVSPTGGKIFIVQVLNATNYNLWWIPVGSLAGGTWTSFHTVAVSTTTRPVAMAAGAGYLLHCTPEYPSSVIARWDGTTATTVPGPAGRALVYHNNRFFVGGATVNPTYLRWSELGDSSVWNLDTNVQPIGENDGEPIEDLASWDRALFIGKENSIWVQTAFGFRDFTWRQLDGGGVAPGRTLVTTPQGIMAIGRERIWWFAGGGFQPISQPIETSYGMTGNYMTGTYIDDNVYVCDAGTGKVWVWDLNSKAWHTETFDTANEGPEYVASHADYLFGGAKLASTNGPLLYRRMPGTTRTRIPGSAMTFQATTGDARYAEAVRPLTALHLYLTIRQRAADQGTILTTKHYVDGVLNRTETTAMQAAAGVRRVRLDFGGTGYGHQFDFTTTVASNDTDVFDIESAELEAQVNPPR